jgi:hypothetical protein
MRFLGVGQGTTEVGVVVAVEHIHDRRISIRHHKMCGIPHQAWGGAEERAPCGFKAIFYAGDPGFEVPRIHLTGPSVNKGK